MTRSDTVYIEKCRVTIQCTDRENTLIKGTFVNLICFREGLFTHFSVFDTLVAQRYLWSSVNLVENWGLKWLSNSLPSDHCECQSFLFYKQETHVMRLDISLKNVLVQIVTHKFKQWNVKNLRKVKSIHNPTEFIKSFKIPLSVFPCQFTL